MTYQPYQSPITPPKKAGVAIAALVVGIVAFLFGLIPLFGLLAGITGVILGIVALTMNQSKGFAVPGLVLAAIATVVSGFTSAALLGSVASTTAATDRSAASTERSTSPASEEPSEAPSTEPLTEFGNGIFVVGVDVEPGTYRTSDAGQYCFYSWKASTGANADTLDSGNLMDGGTATATLEEGQAFDSTRCGTWVKQQ